MRHCVIRRICDFFQNDSKVRRSPLLVHDDLSSDSRPKQQSSGTPRRGQLMRQLLTLTLVYILRPLYAFAYGRTWSLPRENPAPWSGFPQGSKRNYSPAQTGRCLTNGVQTRMGYEK